MAKIKGRTQTGPDLFETQSRTHDRRLRRQRALFIPRFVSQAAEKQQLKGDAQDNAYAIALRWADRESDGTLFTDNETTIDTQFLDQLFGEGLGYRVKTKSPEAWELEHKLTVKGVGIADGALGTFPATKSPAVVIELKGANADLDRDRTNGRSAVQQCWDYLNALPDCPWGIVSNFRTIRLYHRTKGVLSYEEYTLQELRRRDRFDEFYCLFERDGLLPSKVNQKPRAELLLKQTAERQKTVGDDLYRDYQRQRLTLIEHLHKVEGKDFDESIRIAQKLLDRIIFIAFCEDRDLLPTNTLRETVEDIDRYSRAKNPAWDSFLKLFKAIDLGNKTDKVEITAYNGGLFADDPAINSLELREKKWTNDFAGFGAYDFSEEVNVDVLGHLFERSITELEKLRVGGLFALKANVEAANGVSTTKAKWKKKPTPADESPLSKMPKSAQRKRFGIYYTPPAFTGLIVERTVDALVKDRFDELEKKHGVDPEARKNQNQAKLLAYWSDCLDTLKGLTVCDPACGSGAFLIRAYEALDAHYKVVVNGLAGTGMAPEQYRAIEDEIPDLILTRNLYGVDLSREGVEISQLALWVRSARVGKTLADLSKNIVHGNSLVSDKAVDPHALDWDATFPHVFGPGSPGGFSCVIGNPPWERVKFHHREFFSLVDETIAGEQHPAKMRQLAEALSKKHPENYDLYKSAESRANAMLSYARQSGNFPLTGSGDVNLYMLFAEKTLNLVSSTGLVGILVPSGIATDDTTKEFFCQLMESKRLVSLYDFENKYGHFEDVHRAFKFTALVFGGINHRTHHCDFVFFAYDVDDTAESNKQRHIPLTSADLALLNPNTRTCPIFRERRDAELTKLIYKKVPILIDENRDHGGNSWCITFLRMFDQSTDAGLFVDPDKLNSDGYKLVRNQWMNKKDSFAPLYEAKMIQAFDHRAASIVVEGTNWIRKGQKAETSLVEHQNPEFYVMPRWWVNAVDAAKRIPDSQHGALFAFKNVTSPTNSRTMIACFVPLSPVGHSAPIVRFSESVSSRLVACILANFNSYVYDYVARQKIGGVNLSYFLIQQIPTLPPGAYDDKCPWSKKETLEQWVSERVLKLSCTAEDMIPLAKACGFKGSRGDGVHIWKEPERAVLRAELDAAYFHLYGIARDDVQYILSTFTNTGLRPEDERGGQQYLWANDSPGKMILDFYDQYAAAK